jgi:hypothetical protein
MSNFDQFLPGRMQNTAMLFASSENYTILHNGLYRISAIGAGGSGGRTSTGAASGAGGGGFCEKEIYLESGDVLIIVIGAGGAIPGDATDGNDGGTTTVDCAARGLDLDAIGGGKGLQTAVNAETKSGGAGGSGTGGDLNYDGGVGGDAKHLTHGHELGGGGAAGSPYGDGGDGGYVVSASTYLIGAGGGGAVDGYHGGNATDPGASRYCGGAGTGGNVLDNATTPGPNRIGHAILYSADGLVRYRGFDSLTDPLRGLTGGGSVGGEAQYAGPGAGAGGQGNATGYAGALGGGGGIYSGYSHPGIGGGGGGQKSAYAAGGNGLVVVERIG